MSEIELRIQEAELGLRDLNGDVQHANKMINLYHRKLEEARYGYMRWLDEMSVASKTLSTSAAKAALEKEHPKQT